MQGAALVLRNKSSSSLAGGSSAVYTEKNNKISRIFNKPYH